MLLSKYFQGCAKAPLRSDPSSKRRWTIFLEFQIPPRTTIYSWLLTSRKYIYATGEKHNVQLEFLLRGKGNSRGKKSKYKIGMAMNSTFQFGANRRAVMSKIWGVTEKVRKVNCHEEKQQMWSTSSQNPVSFATDFSAAKPSLQVSLGKAMVISLSCKGKHGISFPPLRYFQVCWIKHNEDFAYAMVNHSLCVTAPASAGTVFTPGWTLAW